MPSLKITLDIKSPVSYSKEIDLGISQVDADILAPVIEMIVASKIAQPALATSSAEPTGINPPAPSDPALATSSAEPTGTTPPAPADPSLVEEFSLPIPIHDHILFFDVNKTVNVDGTVKLQIIP